MVAALIRGDHEVNVVKLKNLLGADQIELADPGLVAQVTGAPMGFAGPVGLKAKIVADNAIKNMRNFDHRRQQSRPAPEECESRTETSSHTSLPIYGS